MATDASPTRSPDQRLAIGSLVVIALALVPLYLFNPAVEGPFPPCMFSFLTGLECAGCGTLRGLHALLHGDVVAAWRFNPLMVISLPFVLTGLALVALGFPWHRRIRNAHVAVLVTVLILFTIARNLL